MGSKLGVLKIAASRLGLTLEQYTAKVDAGLKWCHSCASWQPRNVFNIDNSRSDGLNARCQTCVRVKERKNTKGRISTFKGRHHSEETKRKISEQHKGRPSKRKGIPRTLDERIRISDGLRASTKVARGSTVHSYKDGKLAERRGQRFSTQYRRWRFDVFVRDLFTCQDCGDNRGGNLIVHHIKPFADHPELRFDRDNGITLCETCHKKRHYN